MWPLFNPYWWLPQSFGQPFALPRQSTALPRIDTSGIPFLNTNAVQLSDATVDYGINPCAYAALPCVSIVLLRIHDDVPAGGEALPVTIVLPNAGRTTLDTVSATGTTTGTTKTPVVDSQGTQVVGSDIAGATERLVYINKRTGVIRFLEFTSGAAGDGGDGTGA